jgi:hypothetical protein
LIDNRTTKAYGPETGQTATGRPIYRPPATLDEVVNFVESEQSLDGDSKIAILQLVLRYLQSLKVIGWEEVKRLLQPLTLTNQVMSVLEEVKLEAYQEGREEGREEGIVKGADGEARANIRSLIIHLPEASDEEVANLLSKPVELVAQVRREMEEEKANPAWEE